MGQLWTGGLGLAHVAKGEVTEWPKVPGPCALPVLPRDSAVKRS